MFPKSVEFILHIHLGESPQKMFRQFGGDWTNPLPVTFRAGPHCQLSQSVAAYFLLVRKVTLDAEEEEGE